MVTQFAKKNCNSYLDSVYKGYQFLHISMIYFWFKSRNLDGMPCITLVVIHPVIKLKAHKNAVSGSAVYMCQLRKIDIHFSRSCSYNRYKEPSIVNCL